MIKKTVFSLLLCSVMFLSSVLSFGGEYTAVNLLINGQSVVTDQSAVIYNNRTVVPIRIIAETFDCDVDWVNETKTVVISYEGANIYLTVGSSIISAEMAGETASMEIDTTPVIINGRTMVPIAVISELFGYSTEWDAETKTVNIVQYKSSLSGIEYVDDYFAATERYNTYDNAVADKIISMPMESDYELEIFIKYNDIEERYNEHISNKDINTYTAEDLALVNSLADEMKNLAKEIGALSSEISVDAEANEEVIYYVNPVFFNKNGGYSSIIDGTYDGYSDEITGIDENTVKEIVDTFNEFSNILKNNADNIGTEAKELLMKEIDAGYDLIESIEENPKSFFDVILLNGFNAELGAMAEGFNIDIGEDMKEYNVNVSNGVYSSYDIAEVIDAYNEALSKTNAYEEELSKYYSSFTSQQSYEHKRITETKMYYDINQRDKESIDYYRSGLILLERRIKRTEIFADKYGINL